MRVAGTYGLGGAKAAVADATAAAYGCSSFRGPLGLEVGWDG